jgi:MFS family permease
MGFAMVLPFVSLYFHEDLGASMSLVGLFFLVTAVLRSVFQVYAGELSDRIGRRWIMILGQAGRGLVFAVMAVAVQMRVGFWIAAGILALSYVAGAFYQPVTDAAVSDLVPRERRQEAYALLRVANNLGWAAGPMLGGLVSEAGYAWLFVFGTLSSAVSAWLIWRYVSETHHPGRRGPEAGSDHEPSLHGWKDVFAIRDDRVFLSFCAWMLLLFVTMAQWLSTLSVYASGQLGVSRMQLGFMFGMNGVLVVALQMLVVKATRRLSLGGALALGSVVYAVSFFLIAFARNYPQVVACMAAITVGELIVSPASTSLASLLAPPGRLGRYMGWYGLATSFGWSLGPFLGGLFLDAWTDRPMVLWGAVASFAILAAIGFWTSRRRYPGLAPVSA